MKVALVHDYLNEYGGAERVLEVLSEIFPDAPIYTAFYKKGSLAYDKFKNKDIRVSWVHYIPFFSFLCSPLRFLAPLIWGSFNFSKYDLIISSASWYITKGFGLRNQKSKIKNQKLPLEICYCHTPPRWLYGYNTSIEWQKFWPVKIYGIIIGHLMRLYDYRQAQKVDYFIANSKEVAARIKKFYKRNAVVIYPPVNLPSNYILDANIPDAKKEDYYFIVSRLVGGKGLDLAIKTFSKLGLKLKIAGAGRGYRSKYQINTNIQFLGHVADDELVNLYSNAKAFLALSRDEDFGITPVEAMLCGTAVIAFSGGGYKETVINGKTGVLFGDLSVEGLSKAIEQFNNLPAGRQGLTIYPKVCIKQAQKFSKERFKKEILEFAEKALLFNTG